MNIRTKKYLAEVKAREAKASKGWSRSPNSINTITMSNGRIVVNHETHPDDAMDRDVLDQHRADADFICSSRKDIPRLLRIIQKLRRDKT
jgi:hypothetical protein